VTGEPCGTFGYPAIDSLPLRGQTLHPDRSSPVRPVGDHLREWRQRRRLSQLDLACGAEVSARHLSFVETGRAQPSRDMILRLADQMDIPMRERNVLFAAAGYAPVFSERKLEDPALSAAHDAIALVLEGHKPYPAFAMDRHWQVVASNAALPELYEGVAEELLTPPVNGMRLSLHPRGLAPRIANLAEWRAHLLDRLRRQIDLTADAVLIDLRRELLSYPVPPNASAAHVHEAVVPFRLHVGDKLFSFFSTIMIFGTPIDVTLAETAVESFFPADAATASAVRELALPAR
jgi:transcriptional regulator with XRE-family HTH domain